jgi:hypothetical protein
LAKGKPVCKQPISARYGVKASVHMLMCDM